MRNRETYFDQVPIKVVETVLLRAAALEGQVEKSHAPVKTPLSLGRSESPDRQENAPSKGKL